MKITLNLATRPYADQGPALKRMRIGMGVLAGVLLLLGLGLLHFHQRALAMAAQQDAAEAAVTRIQQEQQGYRAQMQQPANARVLQQAQFLNSLFDEKAFSWTVAMEDLERVLPAGVQVTAIEPSRGKDGRLTLKLRISGQRERSVQTVRNMEKSRRFTDPRVSGENTENNANGPNGVQNAAEPAKVTFDILAEYNPPTLAERRAEIAAQRSKRPAAGYNTMRAEPTVQETPRYVAPNPTVRQPGMAARPMQGPGGAPMYQSPIRGQNHPPVMHQPLSEEPSGYDPNGLRNHERNRQRDPNAPQPPQENPQ